MCSSRVTAAKKAGVLKRFLDSEVRLTRASFAILRGYNWWKKGLFETRTKFVVKCLRDKHSRLRMEVYNTLKETYLLAKGKKLSSASNLKLNFCKRLTHQASKQTTLALKTLILHTSHTKTLLSKKQTVARKFCYHSLRLTRQSLLLLQDCSQKTGIKKQQTLSKRQAIAQKFIHRTKRLVSSSLNHLKSYKTYTNTVISKHRTIKENICKRFSEKTILDQRIALIRLVDWGRGVRDVEINKGRRIEGIVGKMRGARC